MGQAQRAAYQRQTPPSAVPRTETNFDQELGRFARRLRLSVTDLTDDERDLLSEYGRGASGEARYPMKRFRALCAIARRSRHVEDREALPELVRQEIAGDLPALDVEAAFDLETPAPGAADPEQRAYEKSPNPITWRRCRDALWSQLTRTRAAYDAVVAAGQRFST